MTILAHTASTLFILRAQDVTSTLQRLGEPTKTCWHLRAAVANLADDVSDTASLCASLWFPPASAVAHDVVAFAPGDKIVRIGDRLNSMYIFLDGIATASKMHTKRVLSPMDLPLTTAVSAVAPMRDITSNFKTTSKTLMAPRHEKRSKSVLPTIMKLSKRIPRLRMNAIVPEEPIVISVPLTKKEVHATDGPNRRVSASSLSTSLHTCWTFKAGDVYGGEIVFATPATSLYNVVAETPLRALRITKAAYMAACSMLVRPVPSVVQPQYIMAKAHWVRANVKVAEGIMGQGTAKKPRFWHLVEQAVSQRIKLIIKHLANMTIFQSMSDETMSNIVASAKYDTFEKGQWIYAHGDAPKRYYVVVSGKVSLFSSLPSLEHVALKRAGPGHGFGEFEILTNQMTRNLSAMAHDTTQLISFTAQTFTELWEAATLTAMRREVSFFQTLGWASRLDLDRIGHLYHAMTEVVYTKSAVIFPVHAKLNHVFILKQGLCTLQAVVDVDSTPSHATITAKDAPPITIHVDLAQVATGHTIWAINTNYPYGLVAAVADTAVVSIGYEMLRGIVPKWVHSDLNRDIAQQSSHHSHQLQLLRRRALGVLNLRCKLSAVDQPRQERIYYVPQLQAHSYTLSQQDDSRRVNLTMTDMVAAQPVELQSLFREDQRSSASDTRTVDASLGLHLTNDRQPHALGSFYVGRGTPVIPPVRVTTPPALHDAKVDRQVAPAPRWRRPASPPLIQPLLTTALSTQRYDVGAPLRLFRLDPIPIERQDRSNQVEPSPLASVSVIGPGFHTLVYQPGTPPSTREGLDVTSCGANASPEVEVELPPTMVSPTIPQSVKEDRALEAGARNPSCVKPSKVVRGKLRFSRHTPWLVALFEDDVLRCFIDEHDIARPRLAQGVWVLSELSYVVEFPCDAASPDEFVLVQNDEATRFFAPSLAEKLRWLQVLRSSVERLVQDGTGMKISHNRVVPKAKAARPGHISAKQVVEPALPNVEYVVAFPPVES
ncbi:hypothetical protein SPRG_12447 [Saprolegnia parasitica CBS 223.65]|uniref:Cyclic nucleotide-binding domain-containing protein n=1 Tax=Saprolegnia parasitica (strain CBS 223.65) TaxID=695850 RepID=A0A067BX65_SAPPC|nr:hypothetical protein SPRG_12447 [Saprolegnia parasitica CBS 223.65]KDO21440.1 hypothetical protein SPRG_12447 [Saprolegnia parasitica CBS 223.65]|eukprot:XP_012207886.1 hypothetical protein SPRG_12447 [Saprolegnia parasitica CBS 223.65]